MTFKKTLFLYPSSPFNTKIIDDCYAQEYTMAQNQNFLVDIIDIENIPNTSITSHNLSETQIVYRGWMLSEKTYTQLEEKFGSQLLTSKKNYFNTHHLSAWYEDIKEFTIPSIITTEHDASSRIIEFEDGAFIKDYVKSLKTGKGSIVKNAQDIEDAIANMYRYRGGIEGGIVLRKIIHLIPQSEIRFFVIHNTIYGPMQDEVKKQLVKKVVDALSYKNLNFYSVDVATLDNGNPIVIEIGDGQVSDYVGWSLERFVETLKNI